MRKYLQIVIKLYIYTQVTNFLIKFILKFIIKMLSNIPTATSVYIQSFFKVNLYLLCLIESQIIFVIFVI